MKDKNVYAGKNVFTLTYWENFPWLHLGNKCFVLPWVRAVEKSQGKNLEGWGQQLQAESAAKMRGLRSRETPGQFLTESSLRKCHNVLKGCTRNTGREGEHWQQLGCRLCTTCFVKPWRWKLLHEARACLQYAEWHFPPGCHCWQLCADVLWETLLNSHPHPTDAWAGLTARRCSWAQRRFKLDGVGKLPHALARAAQSTCSDLLHPRLPSSSGGSSS